MFSDLEMLTPRRCKFLALSNHQITFLEPSKGPTQEPFEPRGRHGVEDTMTRRCVQTYIAWPGHHDVQRTPPPSSNGDTLINTGFHSEGNTGATHNRRGPACHGGRRELEALPGPHSQWRPASCLEQELEAAWQCHPHCRAWLRGQVPEPVTLGAAPCALPTR